MIVTLDGHKLKGEFGGHTSLRDLIEQVRRDHAAERLIVSVCVNGDRFLENRLDERLAEPIAAEDQIDLESTSATRLVADALREMATQIAQAVDRQTRIADQLNKRDSAAAADGLGEFVLLWQTCQKTVLQSCDVLKTDLTTNTYAGSTVREHLAELASKLREIRDALDASDTALLADLMHYEAPELCRTWEAILNEMAAAIDGAPVPQTSGA